VVKPDLVMRKVGRAKAWLDDAEAILSRPVEEFLTDVKSRDLATFYLFLAIQECIDLARCLDRERSPPGERHLEPRPAAHGFQNGYWHRKDRGHAMLISGHTLNKRANLSWM
jgi:hypothetical protein